MKKLFILAAAVATLFACTSKQQQFNEEVAAIMERNNNVGLALVAVNNGEVVLNERYGFKDLEAQTPMAKDDISVLLQFQNHLQQLQSCSLLSRANLTFSRTFLSL